MEPVIASMIEWLDTHAHRCAGSTHTWASAHKDGIVSSDHVVAAWLEAMAKH